MTIFVDSSMWYAVTDRGEAANARAKNILGIEESRITTDHVLLETWLLLENRLGRTAAERFWGGIRGGVARIEVVGEGDLEQAWRIGEDWPDQDFSIVDRTSFAVMMRLGLTRAATLDDDFAIFRYGPARRHAFDLVR